MSRASLAHSMRNAAKGGGSGFGGDPFSILEECYPDDDHVANAMPMHGNTTTTFNLEQTLAYNIVSDNYFKRSLLQLSDFADIVAEAR